MVYHWESGLVYTESVQRRCDCLRKSLQRSENFHVPKNVSTRRTRTLWEMANRRLRQNVNKIEAESLSGVPDTLLERIWPPDDRGKLLDIHMWKVFADSRPSLLLERTRKWVYFCRTCRNLPNVLRLAASPACHWLTDLTLDGRWVDGIELYCVPKLDNVRNIVLRGSQDCTINDRVIRSWAYAATGEGAFSKLESIAIVFSAQGRAADFTTQSLDRLQCFPVLKHLCIYDESHSLAQRLGPGDRAGCFVRVKRRECMPSERLKDVDLPLLQVFVGGQEAEQIPHGAHTFCFRRDSYAPSRADRASACQVPQPAASTKKRKLRDWKSLALGDMLDGF